MFNCSKLTMKTLGKVWKMVKVNSNYFTPFCKAPIVGFDEVNVCRNIAYMFLYYNFDTLSFKHIFLYDVIWIIAFFSRKYNR